MYQGCSPHPALPPGKRAALPPRNWQSLQGATGQSWLKIPRFQLDAPFDYAHKFCRWRKKKEKLIIWPCVQLVLIILLAESNWKVIGCNVLLDQNTKRHNKSLNNKKLLHFCWIFRSVDSQAFLPDPPRPVPGFSPSLFSCGIFVERRRKTEKMTQFRQWSAILLPCSNCSTIISLGHSTLLTLKSYDIHSPNYIRCVGGKGCITGLWHSYATYSTESSQK